MKKIRNYYFLVVIGIFIVAGIYYSYKNRIIGSYGDTEQLIWQFKNFVNLIIHGNKFVTDSFFGINIAYAANTLDILQAVPFLILFKLTGVIVTSYNFTLIFFLIINFFSMYIVLKKLNIRESISLIFATSFAFSSGLMIHAVSHGGLFILSIFPLFFYSLIRLSERVTIKHVISISLLFSLSFYIHEYFTFGMSIILLIFFLFYFRSIFNKDNLKKYIIFIPLTILLMSPGLYLYISRFTYEKTISIDSSRSLEDANMYSANPMSYLFPANNSILYSKLPLKPYKHTVEQEHLNYIGVLNILVLVIGIYLIYQKKLKFNKLRTFLVITTLSLILISFGSYILLNTEKLYLPLSIAYSLKLPVFASIRAYGRYGMIALSILIILNAKLLDYLFIRYSSKFKKVPINLVYALMIATPFLLIIDQYPFSEVITHPISIPSILYNLPTNNKDTYVMDIPFKGNMPLYNSTALLLQTVHNKKIVNGYSAFADPRWMRKIQSTSAACFNLEFVLEPKCNEVNTKDLKDDQIEYIIFEKTIYLKGNDQKQDEIYYRILANFYKTTEIIYSDDYYDIGVVR